MVKRDVVNPSWKVVQLFLGWFIAIHLFEILVLPSLPIPTEQLNQYSLTERFVRIWTTSADTLHYMTVAQSGYQNASPVFFPLWPLFIKATGSHPLTAKVVSCLLTLVFLILFSKLVKQWGYRKHLDEILLSFVAFPFSFLLLTPMSESLYLVFIAGMFWFGQKRHWIKSAFFAAMASATRMIGIVATVYILLGILNHGIKELRRSWIALLISPVGILVYGVYLQITQGNFFLFYTEESKWDRGLGIYSVVRLFHVSKDLVMGIFGPFKPHPIDLLHFGAVLLFVVLMVYSRNKLDRAILTYCLISIAIPLASGTYLGVPRYLLATFPLFIPLGEWLSRHRTWFYVYIALGFILQSYLLLRFFNYEMVA